MIYKHSVVINGQKTSVSLEEPFWSELKSIAAEKNITIAQLVSEIDAARSRGNLSSTLRLFVLAKYRPETVDATSQRHASDERLAPAAAP